MRLRKTIPSAILATTAMTATSYTGSFLKGNNFKEPEILGVLINRLGSVSNLETGKICGWGLHYLVGLLFAELYAPLWQQTSIHPTKKNGLILGGISGLAAILIWKFTLEMHPDPPSLNFRKYAGHLLLAHIIFGLFAVIGYNLST